MSGSCHRTAKRRPRTNRNVPHVQSVVSIQHQQNRPHTTHQPSSFITLLQIQQHHIQQYHKVQQVRLKISDMTSLPTRTPRNLPPHTIISRITRCIASTINRLHVPILSHSTMSLLTRQDPSRLRMPITFRNHRTNRSNITHNCNISIASRR